ncbi:hypothetical protein L1887_32225 [Cichorium endivia]|nr:hypothetical protein L1887_32225 [Cichorium endivia]
MPLFIVHGMSIASSYHSTKAKPWERSRTEYKRSSSYRERQNRGPYQSGGTSQAKVRQACRSYLQTASSSPAQIRSLTAPFCVRFHLAAVIAPLCSTSNGHTLLRKNDCRLWWWRGQTL